MFPLPAASYINFMKHMLIYHRSHAPFMRFSVMLWKEMQQELQLTFSLRLLQ